MKNSLLYYNVGPLLYCPANNSTIVHSLINNQFGEHFSLALCLEDTINDNCVAEAEEMLLQSLKTLFSLSGKQNFYLPDIFIRVRSPKQICRLTDRLAEAEIIVKGFILPKFSLENADDYIETIKNTNQQYNCMKYIMPIFESPSIIHLSDRAAILYTLKDKLDSVQELVLNIRVGGNDLCNMFGFRRHSSESIHKIRPIAAIFSDIITVYGMDYVVSGPVWEYYSGTGWDTGLAQELQDDRLCGFIGKTVIHPNQIRLVNEAYKVSQKDAEDAKAILNWDTLSASYVSGSISKERMNEYKTHRTWAVQTLMLAEAYGIRDAMIEK